MRKGYKITEHPNDTIAESVLLQVFFFNDLARLVSAIQR